MNQRKKEVVSAVDFIARSDTLQVEKLYLLAMTFPTIASRVSTMAPGDAFLEQLRFNTSPVSDAGHGARYAASFLLHVWSGEPFDLRKAWGAWDDAHRA